MLYRCGLERPNPKDIVREHGDRRSTRGKKRGGKKNRGGGQTESQAESETWTQAQGWWQSQDWSGSHGSRSSDGKGALGALDPTGRAASTIRRGVIRITPLRILK